VYTYKVNVSLVVVDICFIARFDGGGDTLPSFELTRFRDGKLIVSGENDGPRRERCPQGLLDADLRIRVRCLINQRHGGAAKNKMAPARYL
jgi:hypothetical protein